LVTTIDTDEETVEVEQLGGVKMEAVPDEKRVEFCKLEVRVALKAAEQRMDLTNAKMLSLEPRKGIAMLTVVATRTMLEVKDLLLLGDVSKTSVTFEMLTKKSSTLRAMEMVDTRSFEALTSLVNWSGIDKPVK